MSSIQYRWNQISWNGISFLKPVLWEIATIGRYYLMLGTHDLPKMEIAWGIHGNTSIRRDNIRKYQSQIILRHLSTADAWTPPQTWLTPLSSFSVSGFSYQLPESVCYGLIFCCSVCHRTTLIQFYQNNHEPDDIHDVVPRVLSTFSDHPIGKYRQWTVFDIHLSLPIGFEIKSYQFSAGFIRMAFVLKGQQINYYRWRPAAILLSNRKLIDFAVSYHFIPLKPSQIIENNDRIMWERFPSSGIWSQLSSFLFLRFSYESVLIRHDFQSNCILAIQAVCRKQMDTTDLDHIFSSYEIITPQS